MDDFTWYPKEKECQSSYKKVPLYNLSHFQLRFLCPQDLDELMSLCEDMFPIDYPTYWYEEILSDPRFYSLAAIYNGVIVGFIVAELKVCTNLNKEDREMLSRRFRKSCKVGYMLSLGVAKAFRRQGIASLLLDNLICHVTSPENTTCKALFLHVLTTNTPAIHFYEHRNFRLHSFLPYYYHIDEKCKDGFTYVLYVNGGHPPWTLYDYVKHYGKLMFQGELCSWVSSRLRWAVCWVWPGMRRLVVKNSTTLISQYS